MFAFLAGGFVICIPMDKMVASIKNVKVRYAVRLIRHIIFDATYTAAYIYMLYLLRK